MSQDLHQPINNKNFENGLLKMAAQDHEAAEVYFQKGLKEAQEAGDAHLEALFYSTLGMLSRQLKDFRQASKYYDKAEKLLPEEPSLKIISARLLIDVFGQYETAIKRCQKVLDLPNINANFRHHARSTMGMAYLKDGQKEKALECFQETFEKDLDELVSAGQMDLMLLEMLVQRKVGIEQCGAYLEEGIKKARDHQEESVAALFKKLHDAFCATFVKGA
ncbi:MAG: hypothetical protein KDK66_04480 [Deltaproteobacteria bacterium]|nr:hypothetical protein [Deltaproteobacteria bacterium]